MENLMGRCEFCGTEMSVLAETQTEADRLAAEKCGCAGVRIARKKECMKERLDSLIGAGCEDAGFSPVERAVHDAIETIGFMAIEGQLQQAAFKVDGTTISIKAGEKTKVTRKYTYEQSEEVE